MHRKTDTLRILLGLAAGGLTLFTIHFFMDPAPITALTAAGLGAVGFMVMRPNAHQLVINLAMLGTIIGVGVHRSWHVSGKSPPPAEGLWTHLLVEGLIGLFVALACLAVAGLVLKMLEQR